MVPGSTVRHKKFKYLGVVVSIKETIASVILVYPEIYNPIKYHIEDLELVNES